MRAISNTWTLGRVVQGIKVGINPPRPHGFFAGVVPRYAIAVIGSLLALIATKQLWIYIQPTPSPIFVIAIVFISWCSGIGPGILASLSATVLIDYYFVGGNSFRIAEDDLARALSFIVVTLAVSGLEAARRKNKAALQVQNVYVDLLLETNVALSGSTSTEDAVQACLDNICNAAKCPVGHAYMRLSPADAQLTSQFWHSEDTDRFNSFLEATRRMVAETDGSLVGRVFRHRNPVWINDVTSNRLFTRGHEALESGIRTGLACPILNGSAVLGVLEFFFTEDRKPDPKLIAVLSLIGVQLGRVIESKRAQLIAGGASASGVFPGGPAQT